MLWHSPPPTTRAWRRANPLPALRPAVISVICCAQDVSTARAQIQSVLRSCVHAEAVEVIAAEAALPDCQAAGTPARLQALPADASTPAARRSPVVPGAHTARGDILLWLGSHELLEPGWDERIRLAMKQAPVAGVLLPELHVAWRHWLCAAMYSWAMAWCTWGLAAVPADASVCMTASRWKQMGARAGAGALTCGGHRLEWALRAEAIRSQQRLSCVRLASGSARACPLLHCPMPAKTS